MEGTLYSLVLTCILFSCFFDSGIEDPRFGDQTSKIEVSAKKTNKRGNTTRVILLRFGTFPKFVFHFRFCQYRNSRYFFSLSTSTFSIVHHHLERTSENKRLKDKRCNETADDFVANHKYLIVYAYETIFLNSIFNSRSRNFLPLLRLSILARSAYRIFRTKDFKYLGFTHAYFSLFLSLYVARVFFFSSFSLLHLPLTHTLCRL